MSDMTIEKARRILTPGNGDEGIRYGAIAAQSFIEGHASRDPEVEKLKATITELEIEIEDEKICTRDVGNALQAEREASRKLVEAVKLVFDYQEAGIISLEPHRLALFYNALKPFAAATPGHSPEGKTL